MEKTLLIASNISNNCMGRAWILADMLAEDCDVEIIGYNSDTNIWAPLLGSTTHTVTSIKSPSFHPILSIPALISYIRHSDAQTLYVLKPCFHNLLSAILGRKKRSLILDIDDWERRCSESNMTPYLVINWLSKMGITFARAAEIFIPYAHNITVSNRFLQQRFGGVLIPHARSKDLCKLSPSSSINIRITYGLPEDVPIVLFLGTPRWYKGLDTLIQAIGQVKNFPCHLVICGLTESMMEYEITTQSLDDLVPDRYTLLDNIAWEQRADLLQMADVIVIPQKRTLFTEQGQSPAKLIDAMASGKPVICSDISDVAETLDATGWLVPPDDVSALKEAITYVLSHPEEASIKAAEARKRFETYYSYEAVADKLKLAVHGNA